MSKKVQKKFSLHMLAWKATPAPPTGPMLGAQWVNIWGFIKEFNDKTLPVMQQYAGTDIKVPVNVTVYIDRSYDMEILPPLTSDLLKHKAKIKLWAGEPNKTKVATLSFADIEDIIDVKMPVMNTRNRDSIRKSVIGTAKSLGIEVK
jgi:large subunit ribosomal protein L11